LLEAEEYYRKLGEVEQEGERLERLGELVALHQPTVARPLC
jgi:hypothetical protein